MRYYQNCSIYTSRRMCDNVLITDNQNHLDIMMSELERQSHRIMKNKFKFETLRYSYIDA